MTTYDLNVDEMDLELTFGSVTMALDLNESTPIELGLTFGSAIYFLYLNIDEMDVFVELNPVTFYLDYDGGTVKFSMYVTFGSITQVFEFTEYAMRVYIRFGGNFDHLTGYVMDAPVQESIKVSYKMGGRLIEEFPFSVVTKFPFRAIQSLIIPPDADMDEKSKYYYGSG